MKIISYILAILKVMTFITKLQLNIFLVFIHSRDFLLSSAPSLSLVPSCLSSPKLSFIAASRCRSSVPSCCPACFHKEINSLILRNINKEMTEDDILSEVGREMVNFGVSSFASESYLSQDLPFNISIPFWSSLNDSSRREGKNVNSSK